jgi:hypothetical protein
VARGQHEGGEERVELVERIEWQHVGDVLVRADHDQAPSGSFDAAQRVNVAAGVGVDAEGLLVVDQRTCR